MDIKNVDIKNVAVDAGRRALKSAIWTDSGIKTDYIINKHGVPDFNHLKNTVVMSFNNDDIICSVDYGINKFVLGKTCDKLLSAEHIEYVSNDKIYIEYSIRNILVAISRLVNDFDKVRLSINLTYRNDKFKDHLQKSLKGNHKVIFYNTNSDIIKECNLEIVSVTVVKQGWAAVMAMAIDDKFNIIEKYAKKDGLVIDIGKKTLDTSLIRYLADVEGMSTEIGTENVFNYIKKELYDKYGVNKETHEIEKLILAREGNSNITLQDGKVIDLKSDFFKSAIIFVAEKIRTAIMEYHGNRTPDWVLLTGGGAFYFKSILEKVFANLELANDPINANCIGMVKFVQFNIEKEKENK